MSFPLDNHMSPYRVMVHADSNGTCTRQGPQSRLVTQSCCIGSKHTHVQTCPWEHIRVDISILPRQHASCIAHSSRERHIAMTQFMYRGSWLKREGRPKEGEVLTSRLVDRPLRPMFAPGWAMDTQVRARPHSRLAPDFSSRVFYRLLCLADNVCRQRLDVGSDSGRPLLTAVAWK